MRVCADASQGGNLDAVAARRDVVSTMQVLTGLLAVQDTISGTRTVKLPSKARRVQLCQCHVHARVV